MTQRWVYDTKEERFNHMEELEANPDFIYLGHYNSIEAIYEELNYQGFTDEQIDQFTSNHYGTCLEIIEYNNHYDAFIGQR